VSSLREKADEDFINELKQSARWCQGVKNPQEFTWTEDKLDYVEKNTVNTATGEVSLEYIKL